MKKKDKKFNSDFWLIAKNSPEKANRPSFAYVYFKDGKIYSTDGMCVLVQNMDLHGFNEDEIKYLNGKLIHYSIFEQIKSLKMTVIEFHSNKILCADSGTVISFSNVYKELSDIVNPRFPDLQFIINDFEKLEKKEFKHLGFNLAILNSVSKCFVELEYSQVRIEAKSNKHPIKISPTHSSDYEYILIMPVYTFEFERNN